MRSGRRAAVILPAKPLHPSKNEALAFLEAARTCGERFEPLYVLAITTGLRGGELLGLRWDDLDRGTLRVGGRGSDGETFG